MSSYLSVCLFTEEKDEFDWGAYLMEGIERYDPSDGELSVSIGYSSL